MKKEGIACAKVLLITGASKGIGKEIANAFLQDGYVVYGCSRSKSDLKHHNYNHTSIDISSEADLKNWVRDCHAKSKKVDIAISNAAVMSTGGILSSKSEVMRGDFEVNFFGAVNFCKEVSKIMKNQRFGSIIGFSTIGTQLCDPGTSSYISSKSALEAYLKVLGKELRSYEINCNVIRIPIISSEMTKLIPDEVASKVLSRVVNKSYASVADLYNLVTFLGKSESKYINGQVLNLGFDN